MIKKLSRVETSPATTSPTTPVTKKIAQKHYRVSEIDIPENSYRARLIQHPDELEAIFEPWSRLMEVSVRPNSFFDPDFLIPAMRHLSDGNVSVFVVDAPQRMNSEGERVICSLFPVTKKHFYGFPMSCLEIWKHDQCFDCTPLIRYDCADEVVEFIFADLGRRLNTSLFSMNTVVGEGIFANLLSDNFYRNSRTVFHRDEFTRSCFRPMEDAETFINSKVSKSTRKGTQRLSRKLSTRGELATEFSTHHNPAWIEEFLALESAGWKGQTGTAIASDQSTSGFFREMTRRMLDKQKMVISRTSLNDHPISMHCDLKHREQAAHFKIAFDESLSEFSPGLIGELANIRHLHESAVEFVDSCADPDHSMINRVWPDRVRFQSLVVALRGPTSRLATSLFPLIQSAGTLFKTNTQSDSGKSQIAAKPDEL